LPNIDHYLGNSLLHLASRWFGGHGAHAGWGNSVRSPPPLYPANDWSARACLCQVWSLWGTLLNHNTRTLHMDRQKSYLLV